MTGPEIFPSLADAPAGWWPACDVCGVRLTSETAAYLQSDGAGGTTGTCHGCITAEEE